MMWKAFQQNNIETLRLLNKNVYLIQDVREVVA